MSNASFLFFRGIILDDQYGKDSDVSETSSGEFKIDQKHIEIISEKIAIFS